MIPYNHPDAMMQHKGWRAVGSARAVGSDKERARSEYDVPIAQSGGVDLVQSIDPGSD